MSCTAAWNQKAFRGRNDDGNETTATWKAAQNTNFHFAKDTNLRIRLEIQETAACAGANKVWQLQYNLNTLGWNNVTGTSSVVRSTASPNLADAANLTDQLTVGTGTFVGATGFDEANGQAGGSSMDVAASGHAEAEFCVQIRSADVASGDTIQLRATDNGTAFAAYDQTPTVTVSSGNVTVTPTTLALTTASFSPVIQLVVIPSTSSLTITTFAPTVTVSGSTLDNDLIAYWPLDEASGNAIDAHGSNDLTDVSSVGSAAGKVGNARDFEVGTGNYFEGADNADLSISSDQAFTIQAWVNLESKADSMGIVSKTTAGSEYLLYYDLGADRFYFFIWDGSGTATSVEASSLGSPSTATWYHIVAGHDPDNNKIFIRVNAGTQNETATSTGTRDLDSAFRIGQWITFAWDGLIDEVGFWKRVLTSDEIADLYNSGDGRDYDYITGGGGNVIVTPTTATLSLTTFAPTVSTPRVATPSTLALTTSTFAPTVTTTQHVVVTPSTAALVTEAFAPTVTVSNHQVVTPTTLALVVSSFAPTVTATGHIVVTPGTAALTTQGFAPTVSATAHVFVTPSTAALVTQGFAPTVSTDNSVTVEPPTATLVITLFAPTVTASEDTPPVIPPVIDFGGGSRQYGGGARSRRSRRGFYPSELVHYATDRPPLPDPPRPRAKSPAKAIPKEPVSQDRVFIARDEDELLLLVGLM
jgi:hypothetical protein